MTTIEINAGFIAVLIIVFLLIYLFGLIKYFTKILEEDGFLIIHGILSTFFVYLVFAFFHYFKFTVTLIH